MKIHSNQTVNFFRKCPRKKVQSFSSFNSIKTAELLDWNWKSHLKWRWLIYLNDYYRKTEKAVAAADEKQKNRTIC